MTYIILNLLPPLYYHSFLKLAFLMEWDKINGTEIFLNPIHEQKNGVVIAPKSILLMLET
jgi:hypothetical protein